MAKASTIDEFHAALPEDDRRLCQQLHDAIDKGLQDATSRMWHAHPVWFLNDNPIVGYSRLKDCLRLFFWSGQGFETPGLAPDGTFKAASLRIKDQSDIDLGRIAAWLNEARIVQWDYKNIVKRKGELVRL